MSFFDTGTALDSQAHGCVTLSINSFVKYLRKSAIKGLSKLRKLVGVPMQTPYDRPVSEYCAPGWARRAKIQ